ncbi:MAG: sigma-70 family RNA polymerase sigma factor [Bacteroidetes bacterium]|nr:sigma-70 family RNA polymerase sigma factor [Bacteroidota bacterium]
MMIEKADNPHLEFEREIRPHLSVLYNYSLRMTGNPEDAEDLVQESLMKAFRFFHSFEKGTNCKAWLFRITKNTFINQYRKTSKEPGKVDYDEIKEFFNSVKDDRFEMLDLENELYSDLLDDTLTRALQQLPPDFRTVVILCDLQSMTYEEIADMIGCPVGTVRSRLHRGRHLLKTILSDYAASRGFHAA